jgi:glycosyltransferase A (GT-A) superfamily protein (DUF2064 family)
MTAPAVIVIAKAPVPGRVKTRCCPPCTPTQAASLAEAALTDTLAVVAGCGSPRRLVVALDGPAGPWLPDGFEIIAQHGDGLGARIDGAFRDLGGPALLIGMDTPQLATGTLDGALCALEDARNGAVIGPAADGGFWALGLPAPVDGLCAAVGMSRPTTCAHLRDALRRRGTSWQELGTLVDVDDFEAAVLVAAGVPGSRFAAVVDGIAAGLSPTATGPAR